MARVTRPSAATIGFVRRGLWWALVVALSLGAARTAWYAVGPLSADARVTAQVQWLNREIRQDAAAERMQQLFPEGAAFTLSLTAIATSRAAYGIQGPARRSLVAEVERRNVELRTDAVTAAFPAAGGLDHGVFLAAWQLHTQLALARLTRSPSDVQTAVEGARRILAAVETGDSPFLEAYPGQSWPVDTVVAMAAVAAVDAAFGVPGAREGRARWVERARPLTVDGLLPHRTTAGGMPLDGPRGSSSSLILAFLPSIDAQWSGQMWPVFRDGFVTRVAGAVGVREHPVGSDQPGDIDSGPLVAGVSLSVSTVTVAAARAHGDLTLATDLVRQAEVAGVPIDIAGERSYAFGVLPVGDAFLAWARSVPTAPPEAGPAPRPLWWAWLAPWLVGLGVVLSLGRRSRRRR